MKTKLRIALAALLSLVCCLSACGQSTDTKTYAAPTFEESNRVIQFNAYAGPVGSTLTDEHMQKLAEAGFTELTALYEGSGSGTVSQRALNGTQPVAKQTLALCEKYGIKYYVRDWVYHEMTWNESLFTTGDTATKEDYTNAVKDMFCEGIDYYESSAFAGLYGEDEPSANDFDKISWQIDAYNDIMAERGITGTEVLINLLPNTAGSNASYGGITYTEYLNQYIEKIGKKLGYLSYDYYPFQSDSFSGSAMKTTYIANLEQTAYLCKQNNLELRTYVQAGGEEAYGYRDFTSVGDIRFQVYMNLAFGSRDMTYYRYSTYTSEGDSSYAFLNKNDGTYNWTYDAVKEVNNEVHAIEDVLNAYKYDGVYCYNSQGDNFQIADYKVVSHKLKLTDIPGISNIQGTENAVLTTLKNKTSGTDYDDAYMLVNYTDPYFQKNNEVKITFEGYNAIAMYRFGKCYVMPLDSTGSYIFKLYPGEGRLIIPLK